MANRVLWNLVLWTTLVEFHASNIPVKIGQVVQEEKLFKEIVDAQMHAQTMDADNGPSQ